MIYATTTLLQSLNNDRLNDPSFKSQTLTLSGCTDKGNRKCEFLRTQFLCNVDSPGHVMNSNVYRFPLFLVHHLKLLEIGNWKNKIRKKLNYALARPLLLSYLCYLLVKYIPFTLILYNLYIPRTHSIFLYTFVSRS